MDPAAAAELAELRTVPDQRSRADGGSPGSSSLRRSVGWRTARSPVPMFSRPFDTAELAIHEIGAGGALKVAASATRLDAALADTARRRERLAPRCDPEAAPLALLTNSRLRMRRRLSGDRTTSG